MQTVVDIPLAVFNLPQYLVIPLFQRPYVWKQDEQWEPLWDDIRRMAELHLSQPGSQTKHFLGAVVLQVQELPFGQLTSHQVIDGQQRLTTLQLVFDATAAAFTQLGKAEFAGELNTLTHNEAAFSRPGMPRLKLTHTNKDREAFVEVMEAEAPVDYDSLAHKSSRIAQAHAFFSAAAAAWLGDPSAADFAKRAESLVGVLAGGLQMVVITLSADENSQEIFETLNARGTPLTAADLIKNFVFQRLDAEGADTHKAYQKVWPFDVKFWEKEVSVGRYSVSRSSLFLNQWLVSRTGEEVGLQSTFARFKLFVEHDAGTSMWDLLHDLRWEADVYQGWQEAAESTDRALDVAQMCFYRMATVDSHMLKPLLLWLHSPLRQIPAAQISRAITAAESWMMRRSLLRLTSGDSARIVADVIRTLAGVSPDAVGEHVENHLALSQVASTYWPGNDELGRALRSEPIYKRLSARRLRPVLEAVEDQMRRETGQQPVTRWSLAIEHVLPQAWRENWPVEGLEAESTRDAMVHRLGNLTLLTNKLNSKVSNGPWDHKRAHLQEFDTILLNKRMLARVDAQDWNEAAIAHRTALMVEAITRIWPVPEGHTGEVVGPRGHTSSYLTVADLVVAGLLEPGTTLRLGRSGFTHVTATVCDNGDIEMGGKRHGSPSGAAWAAMRRAANGWYDWVLEDGRRLDDIRSAYLGKEQASSRSAFDWQRLHALLAAIPAGSWTTYGALADVLGVAVQTLPGHVAGCDRCANRQRVLQADGRVAAGFAWLDSADNRDPLEVLEHEGVSVTAGVADVKRCLSADDLLALVPDTSVVADGTAYFRVALGRKARYLDDALVEGYVGTGWLSKTDLTDYVAESSDEWHAQFNDLVKVSDQLDTEIGAGLAVGQTWVLVAQLRDGDVVLVPTGAGTYRIAVVAGPYAYVPNTALPHRRPVDWLANEIARADMSESLCNALMYQGTVQNLAKYAEEVAQLVARAQET